MLGYVRLLLNEQPVALFHSGFKHLHELFY